MRNKVPSSRKSNKRRKMGPNEKLLYKAMKTVGLIFLVILFELIVPFGVFLLPLFLLNFLVRLIGPRLNRKLGRMLTGMSAVAASDDIYGRPLYAVLLYYFVDDRIDIKEHRQLFKSKVLDMKNDDGSQRYPELKQFITTFMGYSFYVDDEEFDVANHIRYCNNDVFNMKPGQVLDEHTLMTASNDILIKPFHEKRSPWEILIFNDAKTKSCQSSNQSLVVFRYHHCLSDGYSITKLMSNVTTGDYFQSPLLHREVPWWKFLLELALFPFTGMFVIVAYLKNYVDKNGWGFTVNFDNSKKIRDMVYVCSDTVSINKIKQIKNQFGASFNGVVLTAISGGIRKYFLVKRGDLPENMHVGLSFPVSGHPSDRLTNHWTATFLRLPIGLSSPQKRLKLIQQQYTTFETMLVSKMPYVGTIYGGNLFKSLISHILRNLLTGSTCSMSIFPGPENLKFNSGERITSGGFLIGPLANQGVAITVVSYNGALRIFFGIEKSLIPREQDAQEIADSIATEFDVLLRK